LVKNAYREDRTPAVESKGNGGVWAFLRRHAPGFVGGVLAVLAFGAANSPRDDGGQVSNPILQPVNPEVFSTPGNALGTYDLMMQTALLKGLQVKNIHGF